MKKWLEEIRQTRRKRANAETISAAYEKLTGEKLEEVMRRVVAPEAK